jgi:hypothetical protein
MYIRRREVRLGINLRHLCFIRSPVRTSYAIETHGGAGGSTDDAEKYMTNSNYTYAL